MACANPSSPGTIGLLNANTLPQTCANHATLNQILSDVFVLMGAVSVLMIVIAGLRYVLARGSPEKMSQARNVIQYSVIGLIIASLAYAIVSFVITNEG